MGSVRVLGGFAYCVVTGESRGYKINAYECELIRLANFLIFLENHIGQSLSLIHAALDIHGRIA